MRIVLEWLIPGIAIAGVAAGTVRAAETVVAPRPDWGSEAVVCRMEELSSAGKLRVEALKSFYRAAVTADPKQRMDYLLDTLALDPNAAFVMKSFLDETERGVPVSAEQKLRLLELAETNPEKERFAVLLLMLERQNSGGEYAERRRLLAARLADRLLLAAAPERDPMELRQWLLAALLNYGNLSCAAGLEEEAEAFYRKRLQRVAGAPLEDIALEAAALFYSDAAAAAEEGRDRERLIARKRELVTRLRQWDAAPMTLTETRRRGSTYEYLDEVDAAENLLRHQVALSGNLPQYRVTLAEFLQRRLRLDEASSMCGLLVSDFPEEPGFASMWADIELGRGNFAGAVRLFGRLAEKYPEDGNLRFRLALALYGYGETGAAEQLLISLPQTEWRVVVFRLNLLREGRRFREAVDLAAQFEIAMDRFGGFQDMEAAKTFYTLLSQIACDKRDAALARQCLQRFQRYRLLNDADGCNNIGYVLAELNIDLDTARKLVERAWKLQPQSPAVLDSMAWVYFRLREWDKARYFIDAAMAVYATNGLLPGGVVWDHAGDIYLALEEYKRAEELWLRALNSGDPEVDTVSVKEKLERLRSALRAGESGRNQVME